MATLKFNCLEVTYNCILNRQETYNTIRKLAQKDAKNSGVPTAYVINFNEKTICLLLYDKPVEWRNLNKMDISETVRATIKKIYKTNINSTIEFLKASDPDIYPSSSDLIFKSESIESLSSEPTNSNTNDIYIKCKNCFSKILSKNFYFNSGRCIKCTDKKSDAELSAEKYLELDPGQVIKTSNELLDDFVIFDKMSNMTKKQHLKRINQIENRLDDITLALNILLGKSDKLMIVKEMQLYLIEIGDAQEIYINHFCPFSGQEPDFKNKRMLIYGLTDNIDNTISKFNKTFRYIGTVNHKVNHIISVNTDSMVGHIKEKKLGEKFSEKFPSYTFHDKGNYLNTFDDKIIICSSEEIPIITDFVKTI